MNSYAQFQIVLEEMKMTQSNNKKLNALAEQLQKNTQEDFWVKLCLYAVGVLSIFGAIISQIQKLKALAKDSWTTKGTHQSLFPFTNHRLSDQII